MVRRVAFVLAGGRASRFQTPMQCWVDKSLVLLEEKPFLIHVIENVSCVVDEVIVCVNDEERKKRYFEVLKRYNLLRVRIVVDENADAGGPIRAILTGLNASKADFCLIVPCDMPFVKSNVVDYLFNLAKYYEVVMPMWPNGKLETLLIVLKHSKGLEIVQTLCQLGRSRVDDIPRAGAKTLLFSPENIKHLDPEFKSFININSPNDLKNLQPRNIQGPIQENIQLHQEKPPLTSNLQLIREAVKMRQEGNFVEAQKTFELSKSHFEASNNFFWAALAYEKKGAFFDAAKNYANEAKIYEKTRCTQLLERALADKTQCESLLTAKKVQ